MKGWKPRRLGGGLGGREQKRSSSARYSGEKQYSSEGKDRHRNSSAGGYGGYNRRDDDRKRSRMRSRSRSPKGYKDRPSSYGRRDRSRDRSRRDRY